MNTFAQLLREKNISAYRISKDIGIPQSTLSEWKNGNVKPNSENLEKLASYFNVSVDYLMGRTEQQKENPDALRVEVSEDELKIIQFLREAPEDKKKAFLLLCGLEDK